jgi:3-deoxy-D-manno-octulosonate 8-phosphate phosphatase (KDO 8-P phosphatase)
VKAGSHLGKLKMLIMDVDGTLTDGKIYIGPQGELFKAFSVKDGYGIKLLREAGIKTAIITARVSEIVDIRSRELGIDEVVQGAENKLEKYEEIKRKYGLTDEEIGYVGDDMNDREILERAGGKFAVNNCAEELKPIVHFISRSDGGNGAVREIIAYILNNRNSES